MAATTANSRTTQNDPLTVVVIMRATASPPAITDNVAAYASITGRVSPKRDVKSLRKLLLLDLSPKRVIVLHAVSSSKRSEVHAPVSSSPSLPRRHRRWKQSLVKADESSRSLA